MKVKKIHIENYRMLKRIDIDLEENLSLIIGKNNCGKTSFLSILNKFIGSQSSTNNFTYNDFNSDFQDSLFDAINDDQPSWEKLNIKGIELYLFIEYDETDNLSNIQPLMLDLDPDNNIVILKFEYTISEQKLKTAIEHLKAQNRASIATVISYAHKEGLCIIDDKLQEFIDNNEYLYWRVSDIAFVEVQNLYKYIEGHMPFSTQHKIKGLEFKNVLIVLHNGGWNNYNFEYLFNRNVGAMLTPAQKRSYPNILRRTQKLFYVCCTRAKDNLVVYYPSPSDEVLEGAVSLFGRDNCIDLDAE